MHGMTTRTFLVICIDCGKSRVYNRSAYKHLPEEYRCRGCLNKFRKAEKREEKDDD